MADGCTRMVTIFVSNFTSHLFMEHHQPVFLFCFCFVSPSSHNSSVSHDSRVLFSLFTLMAHPAFKLQSIPFKQKLHFLIKERGSYQSGAIMHQALWCLTFSCDYSAPCILSWKSLDCCHLNMFSLASLALLP